MIHFLRERPIAGSLLVAVALAGSVHGLLAAEGPVAAVQTALIREQFLSGAPSGELDEATRAGLRRFQTRHSLPPTGEINTATLQALQSSGSRRSAQARLATRSVVESDREFLRRIEKGHEQTPPAAQPPAVPSAAVFQNNAPISPAAPGTPLAVRSARSEPAAQSAEPRLKANPPAVTKRGESSTVGKNESDLKRKAQVKQPLPPRRVQTVASDAAPGSLESGADVDVLGSQGTRVIRSSSTTTGPDGRTYLIEKKTTTYVGTPAPISRGPADAEARPRDTGFFQRIFRND